MNLSFRLLYRLITFFIVFVLHFFALTNTTQASTPLQIQEYSIPTQNGRPYDLTLGNDGKIWFTERFGNKIGSIDDTGHINEYFISGELFQIAASNSGVWFAQYGQIGKASYDGNIEVYPLHNSQLLPSGIALGSDGNIWFSSYSENKIYRTNESGLYESFIMSTDSINPVGLGDLVKGSDGNIWFIEFNNIGKISPNGQITKYSLPADSGPPNSIALGPDYNIWFTQNGVSKIGKITPSGSITQYNVSNSDVGLRDIAAGKDGNLWFIQKRINKIGKITTSGAITHYDVQTTPDGMISIVSGSNGDLWYTDWLGNRIFRIKFDLDITPTPPTGGSSLNVPLFKQGVFPYSDASPAWEGEEFDHAGAGQFACGRTMAQCGCATSSIAMVFNYHGITKLPDGTNLNPGTLNTWMKNNNGYNRNLGVIWPVASVLSKKAKTQNPDFSYDALEYDTRTNFSSAALSNDLEQGIPNILQVNAPGMHFIVAKGKTSNSFEINDPLFNRTTLAAYSNSAVGVRRYIPSNTDLSYITYIVDEDVEISIKDKFGNGYGDSYLEYSPAQLSEEPNVPDSSAVRVLYFAKPESGSYTVELNGPEGKKFRLDEYIITEEGDVKDNTYSGTLRSDQATVFYLSYDKASLDNTKTIPEITLAMLKADIQRLYLEGKIKSKFIYTVLKLQAEIAERASLLERQPVGYKLSIVTLKALQVELTRYRGKLISEEAYQILYTDCETIIKQLQKQIAGEDGPGGGSGS